MYYPNQYWPSNILIDDGSVHSDRANSRNYAKSALQRVTRPHDSSSIGFWIEAEVTIIKQIIPVLSMP